MNLLTKISTIIFLFISLYATSQNAIDYYNSARSAIERGDVEIGLRHLNSCQNILGGSNAKIESLRFQAYYQKGELMNAAISFRNYDKFLSSGLKSSNGYLELKKLFDEVWKQLNAEKEEEEKRKNQEIEQDLAASQSVIQRERNQDQLNEKNNEENNVKKIADLAVSEKDSSLMKFYQKYHASEGYKDKNLELELDKIENPLKYQRLAEIDRIKKNVFYHFNEGMKTHQNFYHFKWADSLITYMFVQYNESEFDTGVRKRLNELRFEAKERYKWNKEYFEKKNLIFQYDELIKQSEAASEDYVEFDDDLAVTIASISAGVLVGGVLWAIFDPGEAAGPIISVFAGIGVAVGGGMLLINNISYKSAKRKARKIMLKAENLKTQIGQVLELRFEKLNDKPLILAP